MLTCGSSLLARYAAVDVARITGATVQVLEALAPLAGSIAEYCYTDLSRAFLIHG